MVDEAKEAAKAAANKKRTGRHPKLTQEVSDSIANSLRLGVYIETAAGLANVSEGAVHYWLRNGKKQKRGIYRNFLKAVKKALAQAEARDIDAIDTFARGFMTTKTTTRTYTHKDGTIVTETTVEERPIRSWHAAAWKAERRRPKRWGRRTAHRFEDSKGEDVTPPVASGAVMILPGNGRGEPPDMNALLLRSGDPRSLALAAKGKNGGGNGGGNGDGGGDHDRE